MKNIQKAIRYLRKNGLRKMLFAVMERLLQNQKEHYSFELPGEDILSAQRAYSFANKKIISIVVPAYETKPEYLKILVESILAQTYSHWELIIADAGTTQTVYDTLQKYQDNRIVYVKLPKNAGISENTNEAIKVAQGDYIGLLDHDDDLTPDALFEVMKCLEENRDLVMMYSDEDKTDESNARFYELHKKSDFNLDLFLSNNFICHFTVIRADYLKKTMLRSAFDGAQDYDLFLRIIKTLIQEEIEKGNSLFAAQQLLIRRVRHIDKVLYHWRCHVGSTAENPSSKLYAYEAGRKALADFLNDMGWTGKVEHTDHLGFYKISYEKDIFTQRPDVGLVGGNRYKNFRVLYGAMNETGDVIFKNLPKYFSGYFHRAVLQQQVAALDLRNVMCREQPVIQELYLAACMEYSQTKDEKKIKQISLEFCKQVHNLGYAVVYDPSWNR